MTLLRASALWGARCGNSARRVLTGGTSSRGHAGSVRSPARKRRLRQGSAKATASRLVSTGHCVVSPLLSNLFLHYTFDRWMAKHHPDVPFERFADDVLCHCGSERQARELKESLARRFAEWGLEVHPDKTRIVYCKDDDRRKEYPHTTFDFLGYSFRARRSKNRWGKFFVNFSPGVSNAATKAIRQAIRHWKLGCRIDRWIDDLARMFNPIIRGWMNYYGRYYKSALYPTLRYLNRCLMHWAMAKYKRLRRHRRRAEHWVRAVTRRDPRLFAHWPMLAGHGWTVRAG